MLFIIAINPSPLDLHGRYLLYVHAASNAHAHTTEFSGMPRQNWPETHMTREVCRVTLNTFNPRIYPQKLLKTAALKQSDQWWWDEARYSEPYLFLSLGLSGLAISRRRECCWQKRGIFCARFHRARNARLHLSSEASLSCLGSAHAWFSRSPLCRSVKTESSSKHTIMSHDC